jgi:hypothetical protein
MIKQLLAVVAVLMLGDAESNIGLWQTAVCVQHDTYDLLLTNLRNDSDSSAVLRG